MKKMGNNNSTLLDSFAKLASQHPKQEASFDVSAILKQPKAPTLKEIFADVVKNGGKNIVRTAQFDSIPEAGGMDGGMDGMDSGLEGLDSIGEPGMDEPGMDEMAQEGCDHDAVKSNLVEALIALCGSPEAACDCITNSGGSPDAEMAGEGIPGESIDGGMDEPMGSDVPGVDEQVAPQPMEMPGLM